VSTVAAGADELAALDDLSESGADVADDLSEAAVSAACAFAGVVACGAIVVTALIPEMAIGDLLPLWLHIRRALLMTNTGSDSG
jgi:hypothetical protein